MIKFKLIALMSALALCLACTDGKEPTVGETQPLESFALKVGNYSYHANIDRATGIGRIGSIEYGNQVDGVEYKLAPGATISPDPKELVGAWPKEQAFAVTMPDGAVHNYLIVLSAYIAQQIELKGTVLFEDNFDQEDTKVDYDKWTYCYPGSNWAQYMNPSIDQVYVKDGKLILKAERSGDTYKAGGVTSQNKFWCRNARVEVSAKMSEMAQGGWQAIWMMPQNAIYPGWPGGGEIDIMEHLNHDEFIHQTVHSHYIDNLGHHDPADKKTPEFNSARFNTYGVDLTDEALIFHINGRETFRYPNLYLADEAEKKQWPFSGDYYIILNFALGGWAGNIIDEELPVVMEIDWVKVTALE